MNQASTLANDQAVKADDPARPNRRVSLSVVVPVRNEQKYLGRTLEQLVKQQREGLSVEILVVDGRSEDKTREIVQPYVEQYPEVQLLDNPLQLSSAARNIGIENSLGDYIVIIDGHCEIPTQSYFVDLVAAFESSGADCLGRPQPLDVSHATKLQMAIAEARSSRLGHHPDSFIYANQEVDCPAISVAVAYRREVFEKVGLFDSSFDACEDCDLNHRLDQAGMRCRLIPKLAIKYEPRASLRGLFRQLYRYGRGRVRLLRKHVDTFSIMSFVPAVFLAYLLTTAIVSLLFPQCIHLLWPVVLIYAIVLMTESVLLCWKRRSFVNLFLFPIILFTIHMAVGTGELIEAITGKRTFAESTKLTKA